MKSQKKAKLITALICALLVVMFRDIVDYWPWLLPWILGAFAVPGIMKFARTLYIWMQLEDPVLDEIHWPFKKRKTYAEHAKEAGRDA